MADFRGTVDGLLRLAASNELEASEAAHFLVTPWQRKGLPWSILGQNRWLFKDGRTILPSEQEPDNPKYVGGRLLVTFDQHGVDYRPQETGFTQKGQPSSGLVNIVIGRVLGNDLQAYVRIEAGRARVPATVLVPLDTISISYFSSHNPRNGNKEIIYLSIAQALP